MHRIYNIATRKSSKHHSTPVNLKTDRNGKSGSGKSMQLNNRLKVDLKDVD
tara:strand:- start:2756 stop:2908 length:153 start_codon:yes stop_codon:yes gene_type:complete